MSKQGGRRGVARLAGLGAAMPLLAAPAAAQDYVAISTQVLSIGAFVGVGFALVAGIAGFLAFRLKTSLAAALQRVGDLELLLNEAEASLLSEPQVLVIWRGDGAKPERLINNMRGTAVVPAATITL